MALPTWAEQLRALEGVVDTLMETWRPTARPKPNCRT